MTHLIFSQIHNTVPKSDVRSSGPLKIVYLYRLEGLDSGGLHSGGLLPRATDFGPGQAHTLGSGGLDSGGLDSGGLQSGGLLTRATASEISDLAKHLPVLKEKI